MGSFQLGSRTGKKKGGGRRSGGVAQMVDVTTSKR